MSVPRFAWFFVATFGRTLSSLLEFRTALFGS